MDDKLSSCSDCKLFLCSCGYTNKGGYLNSYVYHRRKFISDDLKKKT